MHKFGTAVDASVPKERNPSLNASCPKLKKLQKTVDSAIEVITKQRAEGNMRLKEGLYSVIGRHGFN